MNPHHSPASMVVSATSTVRLGDREVRRLGLGAMHLSGDTPWSPPPPRDEAIALLRRAVDAGVQLIDTADSYGLGHNEELIAEALAPYRTDLVIATKAGQARPSGRWEPLGRAEYLRQQVELSLVRLRVEQLDLFQLHRVDPSVPFDDQIGTLHDLVTEGKVAMVGLSQVSAAQLDAASRIVSIASVQNKYSLSDRRDEVIVDACARQGIAFLPWRPLEVSIRDSERVRAVARELGVASSQVALAWLLHRSPVIAPIPGTADVAHLESNLGSANLAFSTEQLEVLTE